MTPNLERLIKAEFSYNPDTGVVSRSSRYVDSSSGVVRDNGYFGFQISCSGKVTMVLAHRIAYFLHTGQWPEIIDHRDGDRLNNRIENLRAASHIVNSHNRKMYKNNTTGYTGILRRGDKWNCKIMVNYVPCFIGNYSNIEEAKRMYDAAKVFVQEELEKGDTPTRPQVQRYIKQLRGLI